MELKTDTTDRVITIGIRFDVQDLSFWQALKLRLAGAAEIEKRLQELLAERLKKKDEERQAEKKTGQLLDGEYIARTIHKHFKPRRKGDNAPPWNETAPKSREQLIELVREKVLPIFRGGRWQ